jgi:hypothetical protein
MTAVSDEADATLRNGPMADHRALRTFNGHKRIGHHTPPSATTVRETGNQNDGVAGTFGGCQVVGIAGATF